MKKLIIFVVVLLAILCPSTAFSSDCYPQYKLEWPIYHPILREYTAKTVFSIQEVEDFYKRTKFEEGHMCAMHRSEDFFVAARRACCGNIPVIELSFRMKDGTIRCIDVFPNDDYRKTIDAAGGVYIIDINEYGIIIWYKWSMVAGYSYFILSFSDTRYRMFGSSCPMRNEKHIGLEPSMPLPSEQ